MTNPTTDPQPVERPSIETLYKALLCELHAFQLADYRDYLKPDATSRAEVKFRKDLLCTIVNAELKTMNVTVNTATLFIPDEEIPY